MTRSITGRKIDGDDRAALLARFPPRYAHTIADNVALRFGINASTPLPTATSGDIVGETDKGAASRRWWYGSMAPPNAATAAISTSAGRWPTGAPRKSNDVIKAHGWRPIEPAIPVGLGPARWIG